MSILRDYQEKCVDAVFEAWQAANSTLVVMPTGTGKTQVFSAVIKRAHPARALVLAHREELIFQAVKRIEGLGIACEIEMADLKASANLWTRTPVVVSTIQTQTAGKNGGRMSRFKPEDFGVVIIDEGHHATSQSYRKVIDYYRQNPKLKVLAVTATPDRADSEALGQVFESVAFDYEIIDAINDGWLVPIEQRMVMIDGLDFSAMRTTAGDLNKGDLAAVMEVEENLQGIASATLEIVKDHRTLVFAVTVKQAELLAEIFNRHKPKCADWICGETPKENRRESLLKFDKGETQIMVNVGVLTEGYDSPGVEVIVMARPTKSRCLYCQMIGRSTRPLPGIVDGLATAEERKDAIYNSAKGSCLVVDFVGNAGTHKLMSSADILGGNVSEEAVERAIEKAKEQGKAVRMDALLEESEAEIIAEMEQRKLQEAARKAHLIGKARYTTRVISPFDVFELATPRSHGRDEWRSYSEKQRKMLLEKIGVDPDQIPYAQGQALIKEQFRRWDQHLCSFKQAIILKKRGISTTNVTMDQAKVLIDEIAKREGWGKPREKVRQMQTA